MDNGVKKIKPIRNRGITGSYLVFAMLADLGCHVSGIPSEIKGNKAYTQDYEYFNPERVRSPEDLPEYWRKVYELHNRPEMKACRDFKYKYVHCPEDIFPQYPHMPCKGIFVLANERPWNAIRDKDLIHLGNEFEE